MNVVVRVSAIALYHLHGLVWCYAFFYPRILLQANVYKHTKGLHEGRDEEEGDRVATIDVDWEILEPVEPEELEER